MEPQRRSGTRKVSGVEIPVDEEFYQCAVCGEEEFTYAQAEAAQRQASARYRATHGFLSPEEIVAFRRRWSVSQDYLERALGLGAKTVARWEAGRVLQTRAMDNLLRAIAHEPSLLGFFAERNGVAVATAATAAMASSAPETEAVPPLQLPMSLYQRLEQEAMAEHVSMDAYLIMLLSLSSERRVVAREIATLSQHVSTLGGQLAVWVKPTQHDDEPWLREHRVVCTPYAQAG